MKPRALDLFCGAGGATRGLQQAGFHVTGVDIKPQPRYCGDVFHQADATMFPLDGFDFVWASPPCQGYSRTRHLPWLKGKQHPLLIPVMRERLMTQDAPWAIENVGDAPLKGIALTGGMFGLPFRRLRVFETSHLIFGPAPVREKAGLPGRLFGNRLKMQQAGMGCDWMTKKEASEAIPPAYAKYIGEQMTPHVLRRICNVVRWDGVGSRHVLLEADVVSLGHK
jgi:DNA (cytosine-5)-methyltransferase 1